MEIIYRKKEDEEKELDELLGTYGHLLQKKYYERPLLLIQK
jgi:hypothetical protein